MSENVQTAMYEILKKIQVQLSEHGKRFDAVEQRFDVVDKRFDELGDLVRKQRRDTAGLLVMAKSIPAISPRSWRRSKNASGSWKQAGAERIHAFRGFRFASATVRF
jgi:hypothetical protein